MYDHAIGPVEHRVVQCGICGGDILTKHFNARVTHGRCAFGPDYIQDIKHLQTDKPNVVYNLMEQWKMETGA